MRPSAKLFPDTLRSRGQREETASQQPTSGRRRARLWEACTRAWLSVSSPAQFMIGVTCFPFTDREGGWESLRANRAGTEGQAHYLLDPELDVV